MPHSPLQLAALELRDPSCQLYSVHHDGHGDITANLTFKLNLNVKA